MITTSTPLCRRMFLAIFGMVAGAISANAQQQPMYVTYLWHMHQPLYYPNNPDLDPNGVDGTGVFSFSVAGVHNERAPNYQCWPKDAIQLGEDKGIPHSGAQINFSGSLIQNLNGLWGHSSSSGWDDCTDWARNSLTTSGGNPRLDVVGFAYHHSLMPLTCHESRVMQIRLHREIYQETWDTGSYSKGFFPPETAFDLNIIPALVDQGVEWVLVDSIHLERACIDYPWSAGGNVYRPNLADAININPTNAGSQWVQLNNVWAPTKVAAPWAYQAHKAQYVDPWSDPNSPTVSKITIVPAARYEGNENGRGGYGAFKPENVWTDLSMNTNASAPMILVAHSDGDNFGMKNSDAWHGQHGFFLDMTINNSNFENWTVQDYLDQFPADENDIIHIESGSWVGADTGDPEFKKWLADDSLGGGQNPDRFSWSVLIAAQNRVLHAEDVEGENGGAGYSLNDVRWAIGSDTAKAWHWYLNAEASDYWYWDTDATNPWNANVTRGCNLAVGFAMNAINRHPGVDNVGPSIFPPQREPYNPGGFNYNEPTPESSNFEVFSYVDDVNGLQSVTLYYRTDHDGFNPLNSYDNELYNPGDNTEVSTWSTLSMGGSFNPPNKGPGPVPDPIVRAQTYAATITGQSNTLYDYFVEAVDTFGNTNRSEIKHVFVGQEVEGSAVTFSPSAPEDCDDLTIQYNPVGRPLDGISPVKVQIDWQPSASPPVAPDMLFTNGLWTYTTSIPDDQTNVVVYFHNGSGTTDDNSGANWEQTITECQIAAYAETTPTFPTNCENVVVTYWPGTGVLKDANPVHIHIGINGWQDVIVPAPAMTDNMDGSWSFTFSPPQGTLNINFVFNDGATIWDNNGGNDWSVPMADCAAVITQDICLAYGHPVVSSDPALQNNVGDNFDFNELGGAATTVNQGGFGSFGQVYMNYDETNLYIGAHGMDVAGNNNAIALFLDVNTLDYNKGVLWDLNGSPIGPDKLHNVALTELSDIVLVIGDEYGDDHFPSFNLGSGNDFGQGAYYLGSTSFIPVSASTLSQFDGTGSTPTATDDDDGNTLAGRWEIALPWSALNATGVVDLTTCRIAGVIANGDDNGNDRYLSGNYLGITASSDQPLDAFNNFATGFVTLQPIDVCFDGTDTDGDSIPDVDETRLNLDPMNFADGDEDRDGDGFKNKHEYWAGTDIDDDSSLLIATEATMQPNGDFKVVWQSEFLKPGQSYSLYRSTNMYHSFSFLTGGLPATPPLNEYTDTMATGEGPYFYSIAVE